MEVYGETLVLKDLAGAMDESLYRETTSEGRSQGMSTAYTSIEDLGVDCLEHVVHFLPPSGIRELLVTTKTVSTCLPREDQLKRVIALSPRPDDLLSACMEGLESAAMFLKGVTLPTTALHPNHTPEEWHKYHYTPFKIEQIQRFLEAACAEEVDGNLQLRMKRPRLNKRVLELMQNAFGFPKVIPSRINSRRMRLRDDINEIIRAFSFSTTPAALLDPTVPRLMRKRLRKMEYKAGARRYMDVMDVNALEGRLYEGHMGILQYIHSNRSSFL